MGDGRLDRKQRLEREGKDRPRRPKKPTVIGLLQEILAELRMQGQPVPTKARLKEAEPRWPCGDCPRYNPHLVCCERRP